MGNPSLTVRFAIFLSLSTITASSPPLIVSFSSKSSSPSPSPIPPKATPSDLLSLLGPTTRSSQVNPAVARQLTSCFKFLVPFAPSKPDNGRRRRLVPRRFFTTKAEEDNNNNVSAENQLVWWPPEPVLELARLAVDSGGDPDAIHRSLDPTVLLVPDVEGSKENKCELTRTPYGRRFISEEVNNYLEFLFKLIVARGPNIGLNVSLSRYDLFHGHVFLATETGRLGILFHAREYPAYDKEVFPYNMGFCQKGSNVTYDESMNLRNILWLAPLPSNSTKEWVAPGVLVVLDARPGGIIYRDIVPEYVDFVRTIYEDDFGDVVADVNYLNVGNTVPSHQIFIC
ncbi:hypothetical protein Tsubulata_038390 [Turnera subulata]|uniref:Uncharacterized protein n=1 Tax=Turnera subulata TaxID=218843 RepID=A0A9Q0GAG5_9ROSI|nr:hypothetical protein Tsubulata_038390 [Turnera subulata]